MTTSEKAIGSAAEGTPPGTTPTFEVAVSAGTLHAQNGDGVAMPHAWTDDGVVIEASLTGADFYLLSAAVCVLNDVYREAESAATPIEGVRVRATGAFDARTWRSTGIEYVVDVATTADSSVIDRLLRTVDTVAEIPKALRAGTTVARRRSR
jgi:hypothetical protein